MLWGIGWQWFPTKIGSHQMIMRMLNSLGPQNSTQKTQLSSHFHNWKNKNKIKKNLQALKPQSWSLFRKTWKTQESLLATWLGLNESELWWERYSFFVGTIGFTESSIRHVTRGNNVSFFFLILYMQYMCLCKYFR